MDTLLLACDKYSLSETVIWNLVYPVLPKPLESICESLIYMIKDHMPRAHRIAKPVERSQRDEAGEQACLKGARSRSLPAHLEVCEQTDTSPLFQH